MGPGADLASRMCVLVRTGPNTQVRYDDTSSSIGFVTSNKRSLGNALQQDEYEDAGHAALRKIAVDN